MGQRTATPAALVVEDDPVLRQELVDQFHAVGWFALEAASAESGLALLNRGHEIAVAVIGVRLSGNMNGFELARVLRALGIAVPIVYMSGFPADAGQMVAGSVYRSKPVTAQDIVAVSETLLADDPPDGDLPVSR